MGHKRNNLEIKKMTKHFKISIIKSVVRIVGYIILFIVINNNFIVFSIFLLGIAEILGITEEF